MLVHMGNRPGVGAFSKYTYKADEIDLGYEYEWQSYPDKFKRGYFSSTTGYEKTLPVKLPKYFQAQKESTGHSYCCEIKSVVAPLMVHKILIRKLLRDNDLKNPGKNTSGSSGIHVHIGRTDRTHAVAPKVFAFMHDLDNRSFFKKISNRSGTQFEEWAYQYGKTFPWDQAFSHCAILNVERRTTFELRLFGAQPHVLLPAVEFADALFTGAEQMEEVNIESFMNYVDKTKKYKDISAHIHSYM